MESQLGLENHEIQLLLYRSRERKLEKDLKLKGFDLNVFTLILIRGFVNTETLIILNISDEFLLFSCGIIQWHTTNLSVAMFPLFFD